MIARVLLAVVLVAAPSTAASITETDRVALVRDLEVRAPRGDCHVRTGGAVERRAGAGPMVSRRMRAHIIAAEAHFCQSSATAVKSAAVPAAAHSAGRDAIVSTMVNATPG